METKKGLKFINPNPYANRWEVEVVVNFPFVIDEVWNSGKRSLDHDVR